MRPDLRLVRLAAVFCLVLVAAGVTGCSAPEAPPAKPVRAAAGVGAGTASTATVITTDTAGDLVVVWEAESGRARKDPIGLLDDTPLMRDGNHLRARRTAQFQPSVLDAESAIGQYVYTIDLRQTSDATVYKGTMTIDWTATIVRAKSKNEFHAVYEGDVRAVYDAATRVLRGGTVTGTASATDTLIKRGTAAPSTSSHAFRWTFKTP